MDKLDEILQKESFWLEESAYEWYCENRCPYGDECRDEDDCRLGIHSKEVVREYLNYKLNH